jgi:hypothetical protein
VGCPRPKGRSPKYLIQYPRPLEIEQRAFG